MDEEPPPPPPPARPKYKPSYHHQPRPSYHHRHQHSSLHGHQLPSHRPRQQGYHPQPRYHQKPRASYPGPQYYRSQGPERSGPEFLEEVSGLLERAENTPPHITLSGSLRSALLGGVDHHAKAELHTVPGGRTSSQLGHHTHHHRRGPPLRASEPVPRTFSKLMSGGEARGEGGATFSQLMGDLLVGKPRIPGIM